MGECVRLLPMIATVLAFALASAAEAQPTGPALSGEPIVIGATLPLTGQLASTGVYQAEALRLAEEDINASGGINGRPVRILFEDTQASNSTAVSAFIKLVKDHAPPFVFLSSYTPQNLAVLPEVLRAGIPVMYAGGLDSLGPEGQGWFFRLRPLDSLSVRAVVSVALTELGGQVGRPGLAYVQNDYGQAYAREMGRLFGQYGIALTTVSHTPTENDLSPQIFTLMGRNVDVMMTSGFVRDTALLAQARTALGFNVPMVNNPTITVPATLELLSANDVRNTYSATDAYLPERTQYDRTNFLNRFRERTQTEPDPAFTINYYDGAMMVAEAMRRAGTEPEALRRALAAMAYDGIAHRYAADEFGNMVRSVAIVRFEPGTKNFVKLRSFTAEQEIIASGAAMPAPAALESGGFNWRVLLQSLFNGLAIGCIYALMALGFVIVYEATGVVNFAAGQFVMVGAFLGIAAVMQYALPPLVGYAAALLVMAALGVLFFLIVYKPLAKSPIVTIIIGTVAVGIVIQNLALNAFGPLPQRLASPFGTQPFNLAGIIVSTHILAVIAITFATVGAFYGLLYKSALGSRMRAVAQDAEAARLMGINPTKITLFAWVLAAALSGLGGLLLGPIWFVDVTMGDALALKAFAATIIGGFGSVPGAIIGGILVGLIESVSATYISTTYKDAIVFALMIGFLLLRPKGLFGEAIGDRV
jgi:branched-chain amino acid transport system permease protein